jgi:hypothetical protein
MASLEFLPLPPHREPFFAPAQVAIQMRGLTYHLTEIERPHRPCSLPALVQPAFETK